MPKTALQDLNGYDRAAFVAVCGRFFERSPWIADRAWAKRPFGTPDALHRALCDTLHHATLDEKIDLIAAHPDLVGKLALSGQLTSESTAEQRAAGLERMSADEVALFQRYNADYRDKFGFPFVICARENRKDAILDAFPMRLKNTREQEIAIAIAEIEKIARLRLLDAISEP